MSIFHSLHAQLTEKENYSHARWKQGHVKAWSASSLRKFYHLVEDWTSWFIWVSLTRMIWSLLSVFTFDICFVFLKGLKGLVWSHCCPRSWGSCTQLNTDRRDTFNDLSNSNTSCFNACMTPSVWSGNLPVSAGLGSDYTSLIEQQHISLSDLQFLNVTLLLLIYRDLFLPDPTRAIYIHETDIIYSKNNAFSLDWIKNYGKAL